MMLMLTAHPAGEESRSVSTSQRIMSTFKVLMNECSSDVWELHFHPKAMRLLPSKPGAARTRTGQHCVPY
ncbi:hypothetical protein ZHAS_00003992 [Anopheles sinensis]|uniref:Uncharacterized protein n=1 Tax=Anopheles sinensis TaxID=74873 RepID=A0A084VFT4_ANOSI|nr:hypothetical protein ZHAS_00003992 [Anopheles sinensis]